MTAVKHPFESFDPHKFRRFKTEALLDASNFKVTRFCQTSINPPHHPKPPIPSDPRPYAIPTHSRWFSYNELHPLERSAFPETCDPDIARRYKRVRNKMVKLFRLYPTQEVTVATMRHIEGGDCAFIRKVHQFLSLWGLINFTPCFNSAAPFPFDQSLVTDYQHFLDDQQLNVHVSQTRNTAPKVDVPCTVCKQPCGDGHFCSRKYPGVVICPLCFSHQNTLTQLEVTHSAFEFRALPAKNVNVNNQTNISKASEETMIFDKFEQFKDDWIQISEKTESKSPLECFVLFLRNSILDICNHPQIMNYEFNDENPIIDLLDFVNVKQENDGNVEMVSEQIKPELLLRNDWNEIDENIEKIENDISSIYTLPFC